MAGKAAGGMGLEGKICPFVTNLRSQENHLPTAYTLQGFQLVLTSNIATLRVKFPTQEP